jgi:hypothetical protein
MATTALPRVKRRICGLDLLATARCARQNHGQPDSRRIFAPLDDFNGLA